MGFEHKKSTRHPLNWLLAVLTTILGVPITLIFVVAIIIEGIDFVTLLGLTVGTGFLIVGIYYIYLLIFPKEIIRSVSKEMIVFKSNGIITYQLIKDDIEKIYIGIGKIPRITIKMKSNKTHRLPGYYYFHISELYRELQLHGYPVTGNR